MPRHRCDRSSAVVHRHRAVGPFRPHGPGGNATAYAADRAISPAPSVETLVVPMNEATARIKINKLLEAAGWRFFPADGLPANICLERNVTVKRSTLDAFGKNFEKAPKGYIDFLLLDSRGFPHIVLEAKPEGKNPLVGKEQARRYARSQDCRFILLSNGNLHYFWDLQRGNPYVITSFPTPDSVTS